MTPRTASSNLCKRDDASVYNGHNSRGPSHRCQVFPTETSQHHFASVHCQIDQCGNKIHQRARTSRSQRSCATNPINTDARVAARSLVSPTDSVLTAWRAGCCPFRSCVARFPPAASCKEGTSGTSAMSLSPLPGHDRQSVENSSLRRKAPRTDHHTTKIPVLPNAGATSPSLAFDRLRQPSSSTHE